jgi:hypothetical protein
MSVIKQFATGRQLSLTSEDRAANGMTPPEILKQVSRILNSAGFQHSETLRKLLRYLADASIEGRPDLKEYTVGVDALGRSPSYNPQNDSTVRVHIGKLRQRIDEYYRTEGVSDPILITLPKGTFYLQFEPKEPGHAEYPPLRHGSAGRWIPFGLVTIAAFLLGIFVSSTKVIPDSLWTPELRELWKPLLAAKDPVLLSFDTALSIDTQGWSHRNATINDPAEIDQSPEWQELRRKIGNPPFRAAYSYVGFGIVHGTSVVTRLLEHASVPILLKRGVVLSWEDIESANMVFMGTGKTVAKIRLLLERADFEWTPESVVNRQPRPGESAVYVNKVDPITGELREQYGLISMLFGFREGKRILILGGGSSEGDWAAAEYVTKPRYAAELVNRLRAESGNLPESYQAIIRIRYESRVPVEVAYVTHHVLPHLTQSSPPGVPTAMEGDPGPRRSK